MLIASIGEPLCADTVIFDNGVGGAASLTNGVVSDDDRPYYSFDDFTITDDLTLTAIAWTGVYAFQNTEPSTDDFRFEIREPGTGGNPGALIYSDTVGNAVNRVDSGVNLFRFDVYEYSAEISEFNISAGDYWLSIINDTTGEGDDWFWGSSSGGNSRSTSNFINFTVFNQNHDFQVSGHMPEPSGALLIFATTWTIMARRRRIVRRTAM